ncbi:MAG: S41 family peptidase [Bacteroidetes bacterium]|nr:S41 family peptidase [Bacteroidota bacterium]
MGNKKLQVWLPLLFSVVMIGGMYFGFKMKDQNGSSSFFKTEKRGALQETIDLIRQKYVDSIGVDTLQQSAIQDIVGELDPHSVYIPPSNLQEVTDDIMGRFEGIGVEFNIFSDTVNIVYVIPNGPSDKAGLQVGDKIIKVNDSTIAGKDLSSDDVKKIIRGEDGSTVALDILRTGKPQIIQIKRGMIPVSSIDAAYMIDTATGYIKLNKFSDNAYHDFMEKLEGLQKQGMNKLILDLRGNGGGFMGEAVNMADEFLDGNKLIVYTQGNNSPREEFRARREGLFEKGKLVVLVDELTASASEVLSGALQDWDRATIIGRRTFGKGLVQKQYSLSDGAAIRLTIARYYTPLGRSIQRPYDKGKKVYMDEIWHRYETGEMIYADSNKVSNGKLYKTPAGRTVYGGGGIMPDIFVSIDTNGIRHSVTRLYLDGSFNNFVYNYYINHLQEFKQFNTPGDFAKTYNTADVWNQLNSFAKKDTVELKYISEKDKTDLQRRLKAYLARYRWRNEGFYELLNADDEVIKKALETIKG